MHERLENTPVFVSGTSPIEADTINEPDFSAPTAEEVAEFQRLLRARLRLESERNEIEEARSDFLAFIRFMRRSGLAEFQHDPPPQARLMVAQYERMVRGEIQNLVQMLPPGSCKSLTALQYSVFRLAQDPMHSIIAVSNTAALAFDFNRRRRDILRTDEWQKLSGARLSVERQGVDQLVLEIPTGRVDDRGRAVWLAAASVYALGMGGAVVGRRGMLCLVDDPVASLEEAQSPDRMAKAREWFKTEFMSRRVPGAHIVIVTTRWVKGDLAGYAMQRHAEGLEPWDVLRIPMLSEGEGDPLGRAFGEPLWIKDNPGYYEIHRHAQSDQVLWSSMYQQVPVDASGSWVSAAEVSAATVGAAPARNMVNYVFGVDLAYTAGGGDYTVILVAAIDADRNVTIVDGFRDRVPTDVTAGHLESMFQVYRPRVIYIDDDTMSKQFLSYLRERAHRTNGQAHNRISLVSIGGRSKRDRAFNVPGLLRTQQLRILGTLPFYGMLRHELVEHPDCLHDDLLDALSLITQRPTHLPAAARQEAANAPSVNCVAPEGTADGAAFCDADGRMWVNTSMGHPSDIAQRRNRIG